MPGNQEKGLEETVKKKTGRIGSYPFEELSLGSIPGLKRGSVALTGERARKCGISRKLEGGGKLFAESLPVRRFTI